MRNAFTSAIAAATWYSISGATGPAASWPGCAVGRRPRELVARLAQAEALGDELVEALVALEQAVHRREERPRLRALDDAVVVGARDRHDLAHAEVAEPLLGHRRELGRIADGARPR